MSTTIAIGGVLPNPIGAARRSDRSPIGAQVRDRIAIS